MVDALTLQDLQPGHGDYTPEMADFVGKIGRVHRITSGGDVRVIFGGEEENKKWTLHPAAIVKLRTFEVGADVRILNDEAEVRQLQAGHGGWNDGMRAVLGRCGKISTIYEDGDIRVAVAGGGGSWTVNPKCLELASASVAAAAVGGGLSNSRKSVS